MQTVNIKNQNELDSRRRGNDTPRINPNITYRKVRFKQLRVGDRFYSYPYSTHATHAKKIRTKNGCQWADPLCDTPLRKIADDEIVRVEIDKRVWAGYPKLLIILALALLVMGVAGLFVRWAIQFFDFNHLTHPL